MSDDRPRYRQLADALRQEITSGALKPGDQLKTELELCKLHDVSRHTAREALRILSEDGLIARRRGAGTVVADFAAPAFAQPIGDFNSILQYARDVRFEVSESGAANKAELDRLGLTGRYTRFSGLRRQGETEPLAMTTIFGIAQLMPDVDIVKSLDVSIGEWVEREHAIAMQRVTQRMEAVALTGAQAKALSVKTASPALRTVRRYRDASDRVVLLSESLHPAGRFAYEMRLDRTRG